MAKGSKAKRRNANPSTSKNTQENDPPASVHEEGEESSVEQKGEKARAVMRSVNEKAQVVIREDYGRARELVSDAVQSRAYLYPIKGIFYFATHTALWRPLLSQIIPYLALSAGVVVTMFMFTFIPQLGVLVLLNGPLAAFTTVLLVLNESASVINLVSRRWLLRDSLLDTYDGTLISRNAINLVEEGRQVKSGSDPIQRLGRVFRNPLDGFTWNSMVRYFLYLPLNFIPVVGTILFIVAQGQNRGKLVHGRYFQLKGWSASRSQDWMSRHSGAYTAFGLVAISLEMIPILSVFFSFTNAVGAALWAADIESRAPTITVAVGLAAPNIQNNPSSRDTGN